MTNKLSNSFAAMEHFISSFTNFWRTAAAAQAKYQYLASLNAKIANASENDKAEIEAYRDVVQTKFEEESAKIFSSMEELSKDNGEISGECYEMLQVANETLCVFFSKILSKSPELSDFFFGIPTSKIVEDIFSDDD